MKKPLGDEKLSENMLIIRHILVRFLRERCKVLSIRFRTSHLPPCRTGTKPCGKSTRKKRMIFITPGLPEKEFARRSVCRNPRIAGLLLRSNYIEKMGSCIERIYDALQRKRCPEANIRYDTMFILEFPRPTHTQSHEGPLRSREQTSGEASEKVLRLVAENRHITIAELSRMIGVTPRSIERNIKNLQTRGLLERVGPDKGGYWVAKKRQAP